MNSLLRRDTKAIRLLALLSAMMIYGIAGSPSPDHPGIVELLVGLLLITATGIARLAHLFYFRRSDALWVKAGKIFFIYGISLILLTGIINGNDMRMIIRDLPPFVFLLLPLLCMDIFKEEPCHYKYLLLAFAFMGFSFAFRSLGETSFFNKSLNMDTRELYYFANAPSVVFAAIFPLGIALEKYINEFSLRSLLLLLLAGILICLPIMAMALTLQRASLALVFLSYAVFGLLALRNAPYRLLLLLPFALTMFFLQQHHIHDVLKLLLHKTAIYGVNKRGMEIAAVWHDISISPLSMLAGLGWGATFESPAVAGTRVNFTHSFISGMLLKSGILGLAAAMTYISGFFIRAFSLIARDTVLLMALTGPLIIDVFLYASYKWLDFGILLLVIAASAAVAKRP